MFVVNDYPLSEPGYETLITNSRDLTPKVHSNDSSILVSSRAQSLAASTPTTYSFHNIPSSFGLSNPPIPIFLEKPL